MSSHLQRHLPASVPFDKVLATIAEDDQAQRPTHTGVAVRCGLHPTKVIVILAELTEQGSAGVWAPVAICST